MAVRVPLRPEEITPGWLTDFLASRNPGVQIDELEVLSSTQGAATRLRVRPVYAPGRDAGLPEVLFIKTSLTRRMLVADPHMYVTEVRFYERIRPTLGCETPAVYGFGLDEDTSRFAVVIEDLALRGAAFPTALSGLTGDDLAPLMTTLAQLHAPNWGRSDLAFHFDWLETTTNGKTARWWIEESRSLVEAELGEPYKAEAFDVDRHSLDRVYRAYARLQEANDQAPLTVVHGDTHIGNCYLLPGGAGAGLLDWQLMRVANWGNDVGYLLMTALDADERGKSERELLQLYLDELRRLGVVAPSWSEAWDLYRKQMVWGILAWLVTPTAMYDRPLLDALIRRCVAGADELESYALLGV